MGFLHDLYSARGKALGDAEAGLTLIADKAAYASPLDRTVVEGRTAHREHMKKHGVMEAGDMKMGEGTRVHQPVDVRRDIQRTIQELRSR